MAKRQSDEAQATQTLDEPAKGAAAAVACNSNDCELGDHGQRWADQVNFTCTLCPFSTIDREAAIARNPKIAA